MSKLGYYNQDALNNYYSIYTSDLTVQQLLELENKLPAHTIIISSPINSEDKNGEKVKTTDKGTPSILMTDMDGVAVPLTYSFNPNQFIFDNNTNTVSISDNETLNKLQNSLATLEQKYKTLVGSVALCDKNDAKNDATDDYEGSYYVSYIENDQLQLATWYKQFIKCPKINCYDSKINCYEFVFGEGFNKISPDGNVVIASYSTHSFDGLQDYRENTTIINCYEYARDYSYKIFDITNPNPNKYKNELIFNFNDNVLNSYYNLGHIINKSISYLPYTYSNTYSNNGNNNVSTTAYMVYYALNINNLNLYKAYSTNSDIQNGYITGKVYNDNGNSYAKSNTIIFTIDISNFSYNPTGTPSPTPTPSSSSTPTIYPT